MVLSVTVPSTLLLGVGVAWLLGLLRKRRSKRLADPTDSKWPVDAWIDQYQEEAIDPEREIIDPHHHVWDVRSQPRGWPIPMLVIKAMYALLKPRDINDKLISYLKGKQPAVVNTSVGASERALVFAQPYMAEEFTLDVRNRDCGKRGHNVVQTVYLQCGWQDAGVEEALRSVGEARMAEAVNKASPRICNGVVAFADLQLPDVEKALKAYSELKIVRGVRHSLAWTVDPGIYTAENAKQGTAREPDFRRGFALLGKYGLSYDTWTMAGWCSRGQHRMYHEQLDDVIDLAKTFPEQTIIVDHVATPLGIGQYTREGSFAPWEKGMRELAKASENVFVKLSGLGMVALGFRFDEGAPPTSAQLAEAWGPYVRLCLDAFGVHRCMFASNFPVDKVSCDYTVMWNAFKLIVEDYSEESKAALFCGNAKRVYRL